MTTGYPYTLAQLAQILSALDSERRNPNTKYNAIKVIERAASRLGLDSDDVFDVADALLSGRLSAAEWLAQLRDDERQQPPSRRPNRPPGPRRQKPTSCPTPGHSRSRRGAEPAPGRAASRHG